MSQVDNLKQNQKLKLFISYSHSDETDIEQFKKHITPLKDKGLIEEWYDRKILPGKDFQDDIDNNLEDADIICLFISTNFLSSTACKREKKNALDLKKKKGILVVPIIISPCGWLDDDDLSKLLALPTDGQPVSNFPNKDNGWFDVYQGIKRIIEKESIFKQLKIRKEFEQNFLQSTDMLAKAHSQKERVILDDIFVYPELDEYTDLYEYKKINSRELLDNILDYPKIVIVGETLSGKTTLCKVIFNVLREKNFVPVYICDKKEKEFKGRIDNMIFRSYQEQYEGVDISEINKEKIVPIIDDFHFAKNKEKHLEYLANNFSHCILIVDDIFSLNIKDQKLFTSFSYFRIKEFKPSLRYELVEKWRLLTDKTSINVNNNYKEIDKTVKLVDSTLGKIIGKGVMPSYPFYILSTMSIYDTYYVPLDQEITSQGHCYQALIYFYLIKQGVKNEEIDIYYNFLTEFAFYLFREKKYELSFDEFESFMEKYLDDYNQPIKQEILLNNLCQVIFVDSFNNYSFCYPYLYYFFVAKYLVENFEDDRIQREIEKIMNNLHVDENAYIAIFIVHHSKNTKILEEIELNTLVLFDKYKPATLTTDEVKLFDQQADIIFKACLPVNNTPEKERRELMEFKDATEQLKENAEQSNLDNDDVLEIELRRTIKTIEVIGCIINNRAGSLQKKKLEELFEEAIKTHLRLLSSFFEYIENRQHQKDIVDFISGRLQKIIEEKKEKLRSRKELEYLSRIIFWNLNFIVVYGVINKIIHSLGSDKLTEIINTVCNNINTPAAFIIKHGIFMWYNKNLQIRDIKKRIEEKDFSKIARGIIEHMVCDYCALHGINYKDRQKVEKLLGIRGTQARYLLEQSQI